jgi:hypothetical protein
MPVDIPDIGRSSQTKKLMTKMTFITTFEEFQEKEKRLTHRTATMKTLAHAFGTCHCHTSSPHTQAKPRAKPTLIGQL